MPLPPAAGPSSASEIPRRLTTKGERTRTIILDAAERQFAEHGYDGVALRQIIEEAMVQMGQLQYYFRTKEELFVAVLDRRLADVQKEYAEAIRKLDLIDGGGNISTVIRAQMAPGRAWLTSDDVGRHRYLRILGLSTLSFDQPDYIARHARVFSPLNEIIANWLRRLYPAASTECITSAYYLIESNFVGLYVNINSILARRGQMRTTESVEKLFDDLAVFLAGGAHALLREA